MSGHALDELTRSDPYQVVNQVSGVLDAGNSLRNASVACNALPPYPGAGLGMLQNQASLMDVVGETSRFGQVGRVLNRLGTGFSTLGAVNNVINIVNDGVNFESLETQQNAVDLGVNLGAIFGGPVGGMFAAGYSVGGLADNAIGSALPGRGSLSDRIGELGASDSAGASFDDIRLSQALAPTDPEAANYSQALDSYASLEDQGALFVDRSGGHADQMDPEDLRAIGQGLALQECGGDQECIASTMANSPDNLEDRINAGEDHLDELREQAEERAEAERIRRYQEEQREAQERMRAHRQAGGLGQGEHRVSSNATAYE